MTERKFWLGDLVVNVSQMSDFVSCASSLPALLPPEISASEGTIPGLVVKPPLFFPTPTLESHSPATKNARTT